MKKRNSKKLFSLLLCFIVCIHLFPIASFAAEEESIKARVLFPAIDGFWGYAAIDENGNPQGYYAELLETLEDYMQIQLEYVIFTNQQDVNDSHMSLLNGENKDDIDIVFNLASNARQLYQDTFTFSIIPDCYVPVVLYTLTQNSEISPFDFTTYQGKTVGLASAAKSRNRMFIEYAANNGLLNADGSQLVVDIKYYDTVAQRDLALKNGECDIIIDNGGFEDNEIRTLCQIGLIDSYIGVAKGKPEIAAAVNIALNRLYMEDPAFFTELVQHNFPIDNRNLVLGTTEKQYLIDKQALKIGCFSDYYPYFYMKDNAFVGIMPTYLQQVSEELGISIEFVQIENIRDSQEKLRNGEIDFCISTNRKTTQPSDLHKSITYIDFTSMMCVNVNSRTLAPSDMTIGAMEFISDLDSIASKYGTVKTYTSAIEMCADVNNGIIDGCIINLECFNYCYYTLKMENIAFYRSLGKDSLAFVVPQNETELHSILNKVIDYMNYEKLQVIKDEHINKFEVTIDFWDAVANNIVTIALCFTGVFLFMLVAIISIAYLNRIRKKQNQQLKHLIERDSLTGLFARNVFQADLEQVVASNRECSIFMIDIDNFKTINDTYSHLAGDEILKWLGKKLQSVENSSIRAYRLAGDEFTLLVDSSDDAALAKLAESVR